MNELGTKLVEMEEKHREGLNTQREGMEKKLQEQRDVLDHILEKEDDHDDNPPDEEEPGIALEDQLRITEQSAKAIDLLSNHLLSTVWQTCSKNTFGKAD